MRWLESVDETTARHLNLFLSTAAGIVYVSVFFMLGEIDKVYFLAAVTAGVIMDLSTVYFVHSGVLSGTLGRVMEEDRAQNFLRVHTWPGILGYGSLLLYSITLVMGRPETVLYTVFLLGWLAMYISGLYPYYLLRNH